MSIPNPTRDLTRETGVRLPVIQQGRRLRSATSCPAVVYHLYYAARVTILLVVQRVRSLASKNLTLKSTRRRLYAAAENAHDPIDMLRLQCMVWTISHVFPKTQHPKLWNYELSSFWRLALNKGICYWSLSRGSDARRSDRTSC
jgi:hypothetical protein